MIDVYDDLCLAVEFLNRAAVMRDELGAAAYRRAMHQALVALGDAVIAEAERLAGANVRARAPTGTVVPFGRTSRAIRRPGGADDPEGSKRRADDGRRPKRLRPIRTLRDPRFPQKFKQSYDG